MSGGGLSLSETTSVYFIFLRGKISKEVRSLKFKVQSLFGVRRIPIHRLIKEIRL
jgi:hypothetical protein